MGLTPKGARNLLLFHVCLPLIFSFWEICLPQSMWFWGTINQVGLPGSLMGS